MEESSIAIIISVIALIIAILSMFNSKNKAVKEEPSANRSFNPVPLQLQAYERLVMLCERIAVPNLVSRINQPHLSAREMQIILIENVKQEFEYNASQQIYVSPVAWESVKHLKDQSLLLINQISRNLPPDAKAMDLNRQLVEVVGQQEKPLHIMVMDTLNFEARKLMQ